MTTTTAAPEYGIFIGEESARGKGLGTETARLFTDFGFAGLHLHRISLRVLAENAAARRSYEKAGFVQEGIFRDMELLTEPTATSSLWPSWRRTDVKRPMQKIRTCLQKTPNALLCALGAVVFLAGFYFCATARR